MQDTQFNRPQSAATPGPHTTWQDVVARRHNNSMNAGILICSLLFGLAVTTSGFRGISVPIVIIPLYVVLFAYFKPYGAVFKPASLFLALVNIAAACSFVYIDSAVSHFIAKFLLAVLLPVHTVYMCGGLKMFSLPVLGETFYTLCGKFFVCIPSISGIFSGGRGNVKGKRTGLYIFLGLIVALPVSVILMLLLMGANDKFKSWVDSVWSLLDIKMAEIFGGLTIGVIVWLAAVIWLTAVQTERTQYVSRKSKGYVHGAAVFAFLIPLAAIEAVFMAAELSSYAQGGSFSQYARSSFGFSAAAMVYTTLILLLVFYLCKKNSKDALPLYVKAVMTIHTLLTGSIAVVALYRMFLYIGEYGLTIARIVVTAVLTAAIAVIFFLLVKVWFKNFCFAACASSAVIIACLALVLGHPDYICAKYNVDKYFADYQTQGDQAEIDIDYLSKLSPSAMIQVERLSKYSADPNVADEARYVMTNRQLASVNWRGFCITDKKVYDITHDPENIWVSDGNGYSFGQPPYSYARAKGYMTGYEAWLSEHAMEENSPFASFDGIYEPDNYDYGYDAGIVRGTERAMEISESILSDGEEMYGDSYEYLMGYINGYEDKRYDSMSSDETSQIDQYTTGFVDGFDQGFVDELRNLSYDEF